ncbi:putative disease resistance protein RGA4 [Gossypium arboreum]|uniref:putative disease resistance protein RGA4 n=1 Tax=Gossypium arboreum TaxID=29729 RepID=UPI0022F1C731|nr:putative disease resistance protein RGA4 [Gossypium arboreum]
MAESIAFDLSVKLITTLSSFAVSQIGLWWNVKDDLDDLKTSVSTIKALLVDAEEKSVTDYRVKVWLEELKDVLYDADDLLDDFSTEALRKDLMRGKQLMKEVRLFFSSSNQFAYGLKIGRKIKAIKARLASIESKANTFGFMVRDGPVETSFMTKKRQQTHSFVPKDKIIGRDDDTAALLKLVLEFESEENVYIIPIVGFGGLGKTALAQFVYSNETVKNHFELMMWVCVSDVFDFKIIVENIIKSATNQAPNQNLEMDQLQKQLRQKIGGKKYLLVLDDIWNEDREEWVNLKELLIGGAKGSRIIVTTRSFKVAKITSKCQSHVLKGLSSDDAWSLFKEIAFEQRSTDLTDSAFVEIGKRILERCGGIPLVIRTIASTLSYKETEKEWRSFKDNELARISQNEGKILPTLKLSYDHLPSHLKDCFAYCRLYRKDHEIDVQTLVQFWIAQGFIKQLSPIQSLDEIGFEYFKILVDRSFFQEVGERYLGAGLTCKMHDLMHDLAVSVAGTESNIVDSNNIASEILPKSICKILNLQVLKLDVCSGLEELPKKIEKLVNITHLGCKYCGLLTHMPRGIGKLISLETLSMFVVDKNGSHGGADLSELRGLNNLKGQLEIRNLGFVKNAKEKFKAANLKEKQHLRSLDLIWNGGNGDDEKSLEDLQPHSNLKELRIVGWRGDAKFPSWFYLLPNLVRIEIFGSNFKHLPSFAQLPRLQQLEIGNCTELKYMDDNSPKGSQGEAESFFPSLKHLHLKNCRNMKSWWRTTKPIDDDSNEDDTTVMGTSTMAFPCLSSLEIKDCPLTSMPLYPSLQKLKLVNTSSRPFKQTIKMNIDAKIPSCSTSSLPPSKLKSFTDLKDLRIEDCKVVDLEGMKGESLINLQSLTLANFPNLTSLPEWIQDLINLQWLSLIDFPKLTSLPDEMRCLTNLQQLNIYAPQLEERYEKDIGADWYKIAHIPSGSWRRSNSQYSLMQGSLLAIGGVQITIFIDAGHPFSCLEFQPNLLLKFQTGKKEDASEYLVVRFIVAFKRVLQA